MIMAVHVFSSLGETADKKLNELADTSRETLEKIKKKTIGDLYRDTKGWVQQNPGKTMVGVAVTGVLVGMFLRRRR
jgi:ElaB/YqjD/DUF883 family membrane-anchored ribosome-binding protein